MKTTLSDWMTRTDVLLEGYSEWKPNIVKQKGMTKKAVTKSDAVFYPFAITTFDKRVILVYSVTTPEKTSLFISQSAHGDDFSKEHELEIVSIDGDTASLTGWSDVSFVAYGKEYYLIYIQKKHGKKHRMVAKSGDMIHFTIIEENTDLSLKASCIISSAKHKKRFLSYYGDTDVYVSASADLSLWHASGALLSPRKGYFDNTSLSVIGTLIIESGILVLYKNKDKKVSSHTIKMGSALFSLDKPYVPLWRSDTPLWEEVIDMTQYPARFLGAVIVEHALHIYWASAENEIFFKSINLVSSGLVREKVVRQLKRHHKNPIIEPKINNKWEQEATFNPAALDLDGKIHLLYRAIGENGVSVLGYASSKDGLTIDERLEYPVFTLFDSLKKRVGKQVSPYVSGGSWAGCEDPRVTRIGNRIYMTYVSFDGCNAPGVALTSIGVNDFLNKNWKWKKPMLISKPGEIQKNWMIFPEKINGKYAVLHSITPKISVEYIDTLDNEKLVIESMKKPGSDDHRWDNIMRGAGAPPLHTKYGWLVLYHAMDKRDPNKYKVGAMILDHHDPSKILYRCTYPILEPSATYENHGAKSGVVYVCGAVIKEDTLFVYYGGADSVVCVATENITEFLGDLTKHIEHSANKKAPIKKIKHSKQIAHNT
jgi:predicted GH43/DUF377 family glycosyl hydrolase